MIALGRFRVYRIHRHRGREHLLDHRAVARFYRHREVGIATDQFPELLPFGIAVLEADLLGDAGRVFSFSAS